MCPCSRNADGPASKILDNYVTHKTPAIKRWRLRHPRFQASSCTSRSWLNLVERWFALLTEKQLRRGAHRSTRELEDASVLTSNTTTVIASLSSGPKLPTKSSTRSPDFVNEFQTQATSAALRRNGGVRARTSADKQ